VLAVEPPRGGSPLLDDPPPKTSSSRRTSRGPAARPAAGLIDEVALNIRAFQ